MLLTHMIWPSQSLWCGSVANNSQDFTIFNKSYWHELKPPKMYLTALFTLGLLPLSSFKLFWRFLCVPICCCWDIKWCFSPSSFVCFNDFSIISIHVLVTGTFCFSRILINIVSLVVSIVLSYFKVSAKLSLSGVVAKVVLFSKLQVHNISLYCLWQRISLSHIE